jgi:hypothetical protein
LQLFRKEKKEKYIKVLAFSPKASKSIDEQAGLLTYPTFNTFPFRMHRNSGSLLKACTGITAAGTVQELSDKKPNSPVSHFNSEIRKPIR